MRCIYLETILLPYYTIYNCIQSYSYIIFYINSLLTYFFFNTFVNLGKNPICSPGIFFMWYIIWNKVFKNTPSKIYGRNLYWGRPYHFKFFKGCLPKTSLGPFMNILHHMFSPFVSFFSNLSNHIRYFPYIRWFFLLLKKSFAHFLHF